jgi:transporter family protein
VPRWLAFSLLTLLAWGAWGVLSKPLGAYSAGQQQALSTVGIVPIMAVLALSPGWKGGSRRTRGMWMAVTAGLLSAVGNLAYYHAVALGGSAATAVALTGLYPVVTLALAFPLLGERPTAWQGVGVAGSLVAIDLLTVGQDQGLAAGAGYALAPILLWGASALFTKLAARDLSAEAAAFWFLAVFVPLAALLLHRDPVKAAPSAKDWLLLAGLGATYGLGNLTLLAAFRAGGKAAVVTPLCGLYPVVTIPLAIMFFGESIGRRESVGIALAVASALALARERTPPSEAA